MAGQSRNVGKRLAPPTGLGGKRAHGPPAPGNVKAPTTVKQLFAFVQDKFDEIQSSQLGMGGPNLGAGQ
eukprot:6562138-Karenia_brevis.AAC.1